MTSVWAPAADQTVVKSTATMQGGPYYHHPDVVLFRERIDAAMSIETRAAVISAFMQYTEESAKACNLKQVFNVLLKS